MKCKKEFSEAQKIITLGSITMKDGSTTTNLCGTGKIGNVGLSPAICNKTQCLNA